MMHGGRLRVRPDRPPLDPAAHAGGVGVQRDGFGKCT